MKLLLLITVDGEDDPRYLTDEVQAHLESLGYRYVDTEIRTLDNSPK